MIRRIFGMTLIEILIVIVIISVVASIAVLKLSLNQKKQLENTAHILASQITLAEEEAILRPATIALGFTEKGYRFYILQDKEDNPWKVLSEQNFKHHDIPASVKVSLKIQDKSIPLDGKPQIIFSQSGDTAPFDIFIGKPGSAPIFQVIGGGNGEVRSDELVE